ncbi:MAG: hypothetical protein AAF349_24040, partial [Cyanobacteria bacterium P01_A01_bin.68]
LINNITIKKSKLDYIFSNFSSVTFENTEAMSNMASINIKLFIVDKKRLFQLAFHPFSNLK